MFFFIDLSLKNENVIVLFGIMSLINLYYTNLYLKLIKVR